MYLADLRVASHHDPPAAHGRKYQTVPHSSPGWSKLERNVCFVVDNLQAVVDRLAADGYGLVGGIGQYEGIWRMAYVRGPEGIIVALAQRID